MVGQDWDFLKRESQFMTQRKGDRWFLPITLHAMYLDDCISPLVEIPGLPAALSSQAGDKPYFHTTFQPALLSDIGPVCFLFSRGPTMKSRLRRT